MKICLVCTDPADSGEHLFPSVFGGKRINNGIYCKHHNQSFGRHVSVLLESFDVFNAMIGVKPDKKNKKKEIRPAEIASDNGESYLFTKGELKLAPPEMITFSPDFSGQLMQKQFADMAQANEWKNRHDNAKIKINMTSAGPAKSKLFAEPLGTKKHFGGEPFMRSVMYLALTYLAHFSPALARSEDFKSARELILDDSLPMADRVLWQLPSTVDQFSKNPYKYGHTIVIGPTTDSNEIGAFVSFFGKLNFGVYLGRVSGKPLQSRFTAHVDPLAIDYSNDRQEIIEPGSAISFCGKHEGISYLQSVIKGDVENPLQSLISSASHEKLSEDCFKLYSELTSIANPSDQATLEEVIDVMSAQDQRILNLINHGIDAISEPDSDMPNIVLEMLNHLISSDEHASRGLAFTTEALIHFAKIELCVEILSQLKKNILTEKSLYRLMGEGQGISIALRGALKPILEIIRQESKRTDESQRT